MPSKRRQQRKIKREIKRKARQTRQQQPDQPLSSPNALMMKLMAMLNGGGNKSMDPQAFINAKEEKAAYDERNARLKREAKSREKASKEAAKRAQQDFDVQQAEANAESAEQDREHNKRMLGLKARREGLTEEQRKTLAEMRDTENKIKAQNVQGSIDALAAEIAEGKRKIAAMQQRADYHQTSSELRALIKNIADEFKAIDEGWGLLYENMKKGELTKAELKNAEKIFKKVAANRHDLIEANQKLTFEINQYKEDIKENERMANELTTLKRDNKRLALERDGLVERKHNSAFIPITDADGNIIETFDEAALKEEFDPHADPVVQKYMKRTNLLLDQLNEFFGKHDIDYWFDLLNEGENPEEFNRLKALYEKQTKPKKGMKTGEKQYIVVRSGVVPTLIQDMDHAKRLYQEYWKKYNDALQPRLAELEAIQKHNEEVRARPMANTERVSHEMLAQLRRRREELLEQIEMYKGRRVFQQKLAAEVQKIEDEIKQLEAELESLPNVEEDGEVMKNIAEARKVRDKLQRDKDVKTKQLQRVQKLEDETADTEFQNKVDEAGLTSSPTSKKALTDAEKAAIRARVLAKMQQEINQHKDATSNSEKERRMAEETLNAQQSDEVQALEGQIAELDVQRRTNEEIARRTELLTQSQAAARRSEIELGMQHQITDTLRESENLGDYQARLGVMHEELDRITDEVRHERYSMERGGPPEDGEDGEDDDAA